jgi:hypothetical protein
MGHSSIVSVLKTFFTQTYKPEPDLTPKKLRNFQNIAINECIKLMEIAQQLADLYIPDYNKYFLIVFTPLDVSALCCSAIIHDVQHNLPRRSEILHIIAQGLGLVRRLSKVTRTGSIAEKAISQLVSRFSLSLDEATIFHASPPSSSEEGLPSSKRHAAFTESRKSSGSEVPGLSPDIGPSDSTTVLPPQSGAGSRIPTPPNHLMTALPVTSLPMSSTVLDPNFANDFGVQEMVNFDFAELGPVFNWQNVNLFENNDHIFDFAGGSL